MFLGQERVSADGTSAKAELHIFFFIRVVIPYPRGHVFDSFSASFLRKM